VEYGDTNGSARIPACGHHERGREPGACGAFEATSVGFQFFNSSKNSSSYRLTFDPYPQVAYGTWLQPPSGPVALRFLTYAAALRDCQLSTKHFVVMARSASECIAVN
jgi:hypothetical protein